MGSQTSPFLINRKTYNVKGMRSGDQCFPGSTPQNHCAGWQRRCLWLQRLVDGKSFLSVIEIPKRIVLKSHAALKAALSDLGPTGPAKLTEKFRFTLSLILIPRKPNTTLLNFLFNPFILNLFIWRGAVLMVHTLRKCFCKKIKLKKF